MTFKKISNRILSIIPARGGSKGINKKNIYPINGKPLIAYTIEASINSNSITKTIVSSDDFEILKVANDYGADTIIRPDYLATDFSNSESVIAHALDFLHSCGEIFDILILLQPTSPLRDSSDISSSLEYFLNSKATSLISVTELVHSPYKSFKVNEAGYLTGVFDNKTPFMRRQDLPKTYKPNGAIYITYCDLFMASKLLFSDKTVPFYMDQNKSIDIDTIYDVVLCEGIMQKTP